MTFLASVLPSCLKRETIGESITEETNGVFVPRTEDGMAVKKTADISFVKTLDRVEGVRRSIALMNANPVSSKSVVLKPNFNSSDQTPGSTHIETLGALIATLYEMGAKKITLAERSGPGPSTRSNMEKKGVFDLAKELDFEIICLDEMGPEDWVHVKPPDSHWKDGFLFPKIYHEAECIVQTCCLKTHAYGGHFTLSMKNSVGLVPRDGYSYMNELHSSGYQRQMIAEINTAYSPDLVVMDGIDAFVEGGPATGKRVQAGLFLAGSDRVAIDAVGVAVLRSFGTTREVSRGLIFEQDQIARAVELNLGVDSPDGIRLLTDNPESEEYATRIREILLGG
jgi:uncharacterized protein (DUF362 family)